MPATEIVFARSPSVDRTDVADVTDRGEAIQSLWLEVQRHLQQKREEIYNEIRHYPPPIPACDQQFNYLLEQRTHVNREWRRVNDILNDLMAQNPPDDEVIKLLDDFLHTSSMVDEAVKQRIMERRIAPGTASPSR